MDSDPSMRAGLASSASYKQSIPPSAAADTQFLAGAPMYELASAPMYDCDEVTCQQGS